jgi:hypothetical protein
MNPESNGLTRLAIAKGGFFLFLRPRNPGLRRDERPDTKFKELAEANLSIGPWGRPAHSFPMF